jgi:peptide/nickel transport system permease protein
VLHQRRVTLADYQASFMPVYIAKRLLATVPVLIGISILTFALVHAVPGDPVTAMLGMHYEESQAAELRARYGLDRPLPVQYLTWLGRVVRGDLGRSVMSGQTVRGAIAERLPVTLQLAVGSLLLAILVALPLGILAAARRQRLTDGLASTLGLLGISVPGFWLATLLILGVSLKLGWLPSSGYVPASEGLWTNIRHMILPTLALSGAVAAVILRITRSAMLDVINRDYIETARAKGASRARVLWVHALKNALIPIVTICGIQLGYLLGGSVVIEKIFTLPGIGLLALQAIDNRDYPLLQGVILFVAVVFVFINLAVDLVYAALNPRLRY